MDPATNTLLETDLIRTFVTISETGSFTAAARRVFRTPSAVSMQIKRLEQQLGRPLFERHPRHVTLTPDGEAFLVHCREMLRINREALSRFRQPQLEGRVRFGAPDDFGSRFLPRLLGRFASTHPLVEVDVLLSTSERLRGRLDEGEIDLILIVSGQGVDAPGTILHTEPLVWVGARGGVAHARTPVPLALATMGCPWRTAALRALDDRGRAYRVAYTSETGAGQLAAVDADLAITPLPASMASDSYHRLTDADGLGEIGAYDLRLVETGRLSSAAAAFAAHIRESFAHPAPAPPGEPTKKPGMHKAYRASLSSGPA